MSVKSIVFVLLFLTCNHFGYGQEMIKLWPKGAMPNSKNLALPDSIVNNYLYTTSEPRMYAYFASKDKNTGVAVLIVPGGGYLRLPSNYSNNPTAKFFREHGINAFVLCHRLPGSRDLIHPEQAPLMDAQRAMRIIYANAEKWGLDTSKIGVNGTSAGGHVASTLGTHIEDVSSIHDSLDSYSYYPKFMMLISPVISFNEQIMHKVSRDCLLGLHPSSILIDEYSNEKRVTSQTPRTILIHGNDDKTVNSLNSVVFYEALVKAKVKGSLHIFPYGGHAYNVIKNPGSAALWPSLLVEWMKEMNLLK